jgi:hypothetical protein
MPVENADTPNGKPKIKKLKNNLKLFIQSKYFYLHNKNSIIPN